MRNGSPVRRNRAKSSLMKNGHVHGHPLAATVSSGSVAGNDNANVNLWKLLALELNIRSNRDGDEKTAIDQQSARKRLRDDISMIQISNIVRIPVFLEKFMCFGLLFCLTSFLTLITIVPLRITMNAVLLCRKSFVSRRADYIRLDYKILKRDSTYLLLLVSTLLVLKDLDTSKIYHTIKNGTAIKLYVMMGILEVADKLLSSLGQDLLNIVFNFHADTLTSSENVLKLVMVFGLSIAYLSCHSYVFVYQVMSYTVAINSYSNALLTLILSAQFSELKSSVFKKFEREGLFQITCADLTERFQLFTILFIISLKNLNIENNLASLKPNSWYLNSSNYINIWFGIIMGPTFVVIGSEILVDWLKHLYITKFNKIKPTIYDKYLKILASDYMSVYKQYTSADGGHLHSDDNNLDGIFLVKRVGLPLLAMVVVFVKMSIIPICQSLIDEFRQYGLLLIFSIFTTVLFVRLVLSLLLLKWSNAALTASKKAQQNGSGVPSAAATTATDNVSGRSSVLQDFLPGSPSTSLVEMNNQDRSQMYDSSEKVPLSVEEARNLNILKEVQRKRSLMNRADEHHNTGDGEAEEDDEKYDKLHDVRRFEMASKRIW